MLWARATLQKQPPGLELHHFGFVGIHKILEQILLRGAGMETGAAPNVGRVWGFAGLSLWYI